MSASMLETLRRITGLPGEDWQQVDVTIRLTRQRQNEARWRSSGPSEGWSDYRVAVGPSLLDALAEASTTEWKRDERAAGASP